MDIEERRRRADTFVNGGLHPVLSKDGVASVWTSDTTPGMVYMRIPSTSDQTGWRVLALTVAQYEEVDDLMSAMSSMKFAEPDKWGQVFGRVMERVI